MRTMTTMRTWIVAGILAAGTAPADNNPGQSEPKTQDQTIKPQTECPVMGGKINKKVFVDHAGKRIYLCCQGCVAPVKADPGAYIRKMEAAGITLDKAPAAAATNAPAGGQDSKTGR